MHCDLSNTLQPQWACNMLSFLVPRSSSLAGAGPLIVFHRSRPWKLCLAICLLPESSSSNVKQYVDAKFRSSRYPLGCGSSSPLDVLFDQRWLIHFILPLPGLRHSPPCSLFHLQFGCHFTRQVSAHLSSIRLSTGPDFQKTYACPLLYMDSQLVPSHTTSIRMGPLHLHPWCCIILWTRLEGKLLSQHHHVSTRLFGALVDNAHILYSSIPSCQ